MIKSIELNNFQSHKNSLLKFHKGMNVIIGPSDNGKTSIIRGFRLVLDNRPSGDDFRSNWGGDTFVNIVTEEGKEIKRTKTNKVNSYELSSLDTPLVAFGQDIPEEIKGALNMDSVNVQQQLDAPFLLSETSGYVATHFNRIAKLEQIDKSRNYVQSEINKINTSIKASQVTIKEKTEALEEFSDLEIIENKLLKLENLQTKKETISNNLERLKEIIFIIEKMEGALEEAATILLPEPEIESILELYKKNNEARERFKQIKALSLSIYYKENGIKESENIVKAEKPINKVLKYYDTQAQTGLKLNQLSFLYKSIEKKEEARKTALKQLGKLEKDFHENFPAVCPLCETEIKR